ncbi:hypothetical protein PINS_up017270, partial [Pythium insidiosum]
SSDEAAPLPWTGTPAGDVVHIFWSCAQATELWRLLLRVWQSLGIWRHSPDPSSDVKHAAFSLRLPATPPWIPAALGPAARQASEQVFPAANQLWQTHVLVTLQVIWRWRGSHSDVAAWSTPEASRRLSAALSAAIRDSLEASDPDTVSYDVLR